MEENQKVQSQMLASLIHINHRKLNPSLITPAQLQDEINKSRTHLELPGKAKDQYRSVYKLLKAAVVV